MRARKSIEKDPRKKGAVCWITALAVVKFDIDQGNVLEAIHPPDILSLNEQKILSFLAFPDSNSFSSEGALKYVFKFQKEAKSNSEYDTLFGYTYFQQRKDAANARGFSQKSLVILSVFPFIEFFKGILDVLGASYFEVLQSDDRETRDFLKKNFEFITANWQKPVTGCPNEVNLCGKKFTINIPKKLFESRHIDIKESNSQGDGSPEERKEDEEQPNNGNESFNEEPSDIITDVNASTKSSETENNNLPSLLSDYHLQERGLFQDINIYKIFRGQRLSVLWKLWELVLTNQPLLIMSDSPTDSRFTSETVLGLISLIYPLEFQGDYRPYFTIYDPYYKQMQEMYDKKIVKPAVIGVTNPLFLKTMQDFPNILHLEAEYLRQELENKGGKKPSLLKTIHKVTAMPDPNLKKMLLMAESEEADAINNALLRRSIRSLTESFLSAFETYFKLQINDIKKFEEKDFLKFLELQKFPFKAHFASQADIIKVYTKFIKSSNFLQYIKTFPNVYFVKNIYK